MHNQPSYKLKITRLSFAQSAANLNGAKTFIDLHFSIVEISAHTT